jgi:hypothetical protein
MDCWVDFQGQFFCFVCLGFGAGWVGGSGEWDAWSDGELLQRPCVSSLSTCRLVEFEVLEAGESVRTQEQEQRWCDNQGEQSFEVCLKYGRGAQGVGAGATRVRQPRGAEL